jgi:predicted alpha/beta superfamily hydrolase
VTVHSTAATVVEVVYPPERGRIGLRGSHAPLSWERTEPPRKVIGSRHLFRIPLHEDEMLELKVVRDEALDGGRSYVVHAGDHLKIEPCFERTKPRFEPVFIVEENGQRADVEVLLPPSYDEQPEKRYPILYVLDGQSLWSHSEDPFGTWHLDETLASLYEVGAIEELVVAGIHTSEARIERLTPTPDPGYGGGQGAAFLEHLVGPVRAALDARFRTKGDGAGILGSSLGGLFAFFAAWTKPTVFGKAACLSSSFWWANRWAVRLVQATTPPDPKPFLYLDSGATSDGFHHTGSMHRALKKAGFDLATEVHRLVFPGEPHHAASWASRVALPLQLLFPRDPIGPDEWPPSKRH